jgi:manganese/iron transport system permease protein
MIEHSMDILAYPPIQRAVIACVLCGASCSLLSVFIVLMRMPLIGVSMSHAAFAGAVLGMLLDVNPVLIGFIVCLLVAGVLGPLSDHSDMAPENLLGIMFSFLMGLAFLGMGILTKTKASALNLMWGSLLSLSSSDIAVLTLVTSILVLFVLLFFKEIRSVLFNRRLAAANGVPERMIYYALLFLTGAVVSSNLTTVGGLLIFALLVQPGATALQLTYNLKHFFIISAASGIGACVFGLIASYIFDLPSGAAVVLMATIIFAAAYILSPKRRMTKPKKRSVSHGHDIG